MGASWQIDRLAAKDFHFKDKLALSQRRYFRTAGDLTYIGDVLTRSDVITRIINGGVNMPAYGSSLKPAEIDALVAFLQSRTRAGHPASGNPPPAAVRC